MRLGQQQPEELAETAAGAPAPAAPPVTNRVRAGYAHRSPAHSVDSAGGGGGTKSGNRSTASSVASAASAKSIDSKGNDSRLFSQMLPLLRDLQVNGTTTGEILEHAGLTTPLPRLDPNPEDTRTYDVTPDQATVLMHPALSPFVEVKHPETEETLTDQERLETLDNGRVRVILQPTKMLQLTNAVAYGVERQSRGDFLYAVNPNDTVFNVVAENTMEVKLVIDEQDLGNITAGVISQKMPFTINQSDEVKSVRAHANRLMLRVCGPELDAAAGSTAGNRSRLHSAASRASTRSTALVVDSNCLGNKQCAIL